MLFLKSILTLGLLFASLTVISQHSLPTLTDSIDSRILNETRGLQVIMPKNYTPGSKQKYEVVYILDGEWYHELVPYTYNFAESAAYVPKSMFVLIRNRYRDGVNLRGRDFSPVKIDGDSMSGGADNFYDFITKEVVPYVEKKYPVNGQRALVGSSFSGMFSVYAFLKDPTFFQSFISSDPNIVYGDHYVTRMAKKTLDKLPANAGTLFIGCLANTSRDMGSLGFDSVLQKDAPATLKWKVVQYSGESHYSVQLKAFYDAFRFSHGGFGVSPQFHPMTGIIDPQTSFNVLFTNEAPGARFTADGSEPDSSSKEIREGQHISIKPPAKIRIKTFGNRLMYSKEWSTVFEKGKLTPVKTKAMPGLQYATYNVTTDSLPATIPAKVVKSGKIDSAFLMAPLIGSNPTLVVLDGILNISQDAVYIFYCNGYDAMEFVIAGKRVMKSTAQPGGDSYALSLTKGNYQVKLSLVKKPGDMPPVFLIFRSTPESGKWWEGAPWRRF